VREDRILRKIFGYKREELTGDWAELYSEELYDLYCVLHGAELFLRS
jgi:hypothetical protein